MKHKIIKILIILFTILCIIGIIYSSYNIILWKKNTKYNNELKDRLNEYIHIDTNDEIDTYIIDFDKLKESNSDTVAYLRVKGTNIDYVVVQTNNNDYYLNHNYDKKYNIAGWIFADYNNKLDGTDKNLIIYGHNIKDGSMFGSIKRVLEKDWQENESNLTIDLVTSTGTTKYRVFSTYMIEPEDYYIRTSFNSDEFNEFINKLKDRSNYDYGIDVNGEDQILTLSSCNTTGSKRIVLHAKKMID